MKSKVFFWIFLCALTSLVSYAQEIDDPVANPQSVIIQGNARFTILTPRLIRLEYDSTGTFTDNASFFVINRRLDPVTYKKSSNHGWVIIKTEALELKYKSGSGKFSATNLQIIMHQKGAEQQWKPGTPDVQNLKGTYRTLDGMNGNINGWNQTPLILEDGLLSREGWTFIDDSRNFLFDNSDWKWVKVRDHAEQDYYFISYGTDYKAALSDITLISGKVPLPPLYVFGYWWSRYWNYSDAELRDLTGKFKKYQIPLDVLVIDMDWHKTDGLSFIQGKSKADAFGQLPGWTGYTWNTSLFPDPGKFLLWTKSQQLKTTLNLHPASGITASEAVYPAFARAMDFDTLGHNSIPFEAADKKFVNNWFSLVLHPLQESGVSFWWLDWQQWKDSKLIQGLSNTWWLNYVFYTDMQRQGKQRPILYHRWGGLGNHRYQIGFSGDAIISWKSLDFQPYFTSTASNVLYGYWSHDLGGHMFGKVEESQKKIDPELYTRWMQYGVFSPVFRTHSSKDPRLQKEIWNFTGSYFDALTDAINLRYALVPYIYTMARKTYDTGISLCRPMYFDYPEDQKSYEYKNEYMFGDDLLVMPVTSPADSSLSSAKVWLPEGNDWYEWSTGTMLKGGQQVERRYLLNEYPVFVKSGAIIPMYPHISNLQNRIDGLILKIFPGADYHSRLYEDGGDDEQYKNGKFTYTEFATEHQRDGSLKVFVKPRQGSFEGMLTRRNFEIQLYGSVIPAKIMADGQDVPITTGQNANSWTYSGKDLTTHIFLNQTDCNHKLEILIQYNGIKEDVDGMIGKMNRLREATLYLKNHWFDGSPLPAMITSEDQAWLQINYHPELFDSIVKNFKLNYPQIHQLIDSTHVDMATKTQCSVFMK